MQQHAVSALTGLIDHSRKRHGLPRAGQTDQVDMPDFAFTGQLDATDA